MKLRNARLAIRTHFRTRPGFTLSRSARVVSFQLERHVSFIMGQKVHPLGFRLGITQKHQSQWYASFHRKQYAQGIVEDHMLRQTLTKLFEGLSEQNNKAREVAPNITQIKIERGLIPFDIRIHIHADKCKLLKSSLDQLKLDRDTMQALQKTRRSLSDLGNVVLPIRYEGNDSSSDKTRGKKQKPSTTLLRRGSQRRTAGGKTRGPQGGPQRGSKRGPQRGAQGRSFQAKWVSGPARQRQMSRRRQSNRQAVLAYWRKRWSKGLRVAYKKTKWVVGSRVLQRKNVLSMKVRRTQSRQRTARRDQRLRSPMSLGTGRFDVSTRSRMVSRGTGVGSSVIQPIAPERLARLSISRAQKTVLKSSLELLNERFLTQLQRSLGFWKGRLPMASATVQPERIKPTEQGAASLASLGYRFHWSLRRLKALKKQPRAKLVRLLKTLRLRTWKRLNLFRREALAYGGATFTHGLSYYQAVRFMEELERLVKTTKAPSKRQGASDTADTSKRRIRKKKRPSDGSPSWRIYFMRKRLKNRVDEARRLKLRVYLKQQVQKHRQQHVYHYLSTLRYAQEQLDILGERGREWASSLFNLEKGYQDTASRDDVKERVRQALATAATQPEWSRTKPQKLMRWVERDRRVFQQNLRLTPIISIKFFEVAADNVGSKASVIAHGIVDQLRQRKPFRRVIKTAKNDAMKQRDVRGIKIQVAGRLNGAEIARTEWVRSGRVPLQTLRANIDYTYQTAQTIYGVIGIKVWVFKGDHA